MMITNKNPIIQCKKPGCNKTFAKYYVDKKGRVRWSETREYCCCWHALGKKYSPETIEKMSLSQKCKHRSDSTKHKMRLANLGEKNPIWKDDDVGIKALHAWINRNRPNPQSGLCEICNILPLPDAANVTGTYNRDFINWKYLCRSCHFKLDFANGTKKPTNVSGDKNPMFGKRGKDNPLFGKRQTDETRLRVKLTKESRKYAIKNHMSGTFRTGLERDWIEESSKSKEIAGFSIISKYVEVKKK